MTATNPCAPEENDELHQPLPTTVYLFFFFKKKKKNPPLKSDNIHINRQQGKYDICRNTLHRPIVATANVV